MCVRSRTPDKNGKRQEGGTVQKLRCIKYGYTAGQSVHLVNHILWVSEAFEDYVYLDPIKDGGTGSKGFDDALGGYGHGWEKLETK